MENCAGGELFDYIQTAGGAGALARDIQRAQRAPRQQPLTRGSRSAWIKHVQSLFQQLVREVAFMHRNGVVHRDLSLENSMLADAALTVAKTIDYGLAKTFDVRDLTPERDTAAADEPDGSAIKPAAEERRSRSYMMLGSVGKRGYMSPETLRGHRAEYDARANDIWCLGVMLFMMLVGAPPFPEARFARRGGRRGTFDYIMGGHMVAVLKQWRRLPLVTDEAISLLQAIFRVESRRISMSDLLAHPFMQPDDDGASRRRPKDASASSRVESATKPSVSTSATETSVSPSTTSSSSSSSTASPSSSSAATREASGDVSMASPASREGEDSPPAMRSPSGSARRDSRSVRTEHRRQRSEDAGMESGHGITPGGDAEDVEMKQGSYVTEDAKMIKSKLESRKNDDGLHKLLEEVKLLITKHSNGTTVEGVEESRREGETDETKDTDKALQRCIDELQRLKLEIEYEQKRLSRTESDAPMPSKSEAGAVTDSRLPADKPVTGTSMSA